MGGRTRGPAARNLRVEHSIVGRVVVDGNTVTGTDRDRRRGRGRLKGTHKGDPRPGRRRGQRADAANGGVQINVARGDFGIPVDAVACSRLDVGRAGHVPAAGREAGGLGGGNRPVANDDVAVRLGDDLGCGHRRGARRPGGDREIAVIGPQVNRASRQDAAIDVDVRASQPNPVHSPDRAIDGHVVRVAYAACVDHDAARGDDAGFGANRHRAVPRFQRNARQLGSELTQYSLDIDAAGALR